MSDVTVTEGLAAAVAAAVDEDQLRVAVETAVAALAVRCQQRRPVLDLAHEWAAVLREAVATAARITPNEGLSWTWVVSGSVARGEPAPGSDVETIVVLGDDADDAHKSEALSGAVAVHAMLERCGVGGDANGVLASRPRFCRRHSSWAEGAQRWTADPARDRGVVMTGLMADSLAVLTGDGQSTSVLARLVRDGVAVHPQASKALIADATSFRAHVPSRLRALARQSDLVDVKSACIDPVVKIARWGALCSEADVRSTPDRLEAAEAARTLDSDDARSLAECFAWLTRLRWRIRMNWFTEGAGVSDTVSLSELSPHDRASLRSVSREIAGVARKLRYLNNVAM